MPEPSSNKFRAAIDVLQRSRNLLVESLAEEAIQQRDDLVEGGFALNEFLDLHGSRLHFIGLILGQLEQSAEAIEAPPPAPSRRQPSAPRSARPRGRRLAKSRGKAPESDAHPEPEDQIDEPPL